MTNDEELCFETYFQAYNMTLEERDFYLSLLAHTKEIESSTRVVDPTRPLSSYETLSTSSNSHIFIDEDETFPVFSTLIKANKDNKLVESTKGKPFDFVIMSLRKEDNGVITFNGAIANSIERKWIDGIIEQVESNTYSISTNVYRFYEHLRDSERMYQVRDDMCLFDDRMVRETRYFDAIRYERYVEELPALTEQRRKDYIAELVRKLK